VLGAIDKLEMMRFKQSNILEMPVRRLMKAYLRGFVKKTKKHNKNPK